VPLTPDAIDQHIAHWGSLLASSRSRYRKFWPKYLFRHERVENAALILKSGQLLSRIGSAQIQHIDVAAADVVSATDRAHAAARLYFRPTTPTQYHLEGIKKPNEYYRENVHAPVLVMFAFNAKTVLNLPGVAFSDGNMQSPTTIVGSDKKFFEQLPFDAVYHVGAFVPEERDRILRARCAEVLAPSPLTLRGHLQAIVCRSPAERAFLLHLAGAQAASVWSRRTSVFAEQGVFENKWVYVDSVEATSDGVKIKFHPRVDSKPIDFDAEIWRDETCIYRGGKNDANAAMIWRLKCVLANGQYRVRIKVESCLAYEALVLVDDLPF
jgi:hypothetical protein